MNKLIITFIFLTFITNMKAQDISMNDLKNNSEIIFVKFENDSPIIKSNNIDVNSKLYILGKADAKSYYNYYGSFTGSFFTSLILPPVGLITAVVLTTYPPQDHNNLTIPEFRKPLAQKPEYFQGYFDQASKMKNRRTWTGFCIGVSFFTAGYLMFGYL